MLKLSLKYRIAAVIFLLEAVMMFFVLGFILNHSLNENRKNLQVNETVVINQLADLSRIALFTSEFDDLQPYIEQIVDDPHIVKVLLYNQQDRVIVSNDVTDIGRSPPKLIDDTEHFWRTKIIQNTSGVLGTIAINFSHSQLIASNNRTTKLGITVALTGMLIIAIVGILIGFLLTRRLEILSNAATQLSEGNLEVRTNFSGNDEVSIVGNAFDRMAQNISRFIKDLHEGEINLRKAHAELEQRVEQRTAQLAIARDGALEASRTKSKFLANMSHELRTPLNAIIGYSEILIEDAQQMEIEQFIKDLSKINASGSHLLALVNDVLDLSKVEAGKMEFTFNNFELEPFIEEILGSVSPLIEKNKNVLSVDFPDNPGSMYADLTKTRQILVNLLSNAIKFAAGKAIRFRLKREQKDNREWVIFIVEDKGIGIASEKLDNLFDEFSQFDAAATNKFGGTGLGLAISQKFCNMMGGNISVTSKKDVGSTFTVKLPANVSSQENVA